jgi:predicted alpha/beta superfamily hydrolase
VTGPGAARREVQVAAPPGWDPVTGPALPVLYLQDGQNLFDPATSYAGHWGVLETLAELGGAHPMLVVGVPNLGVGRLKEYSPFDDAIRGVGEGVGYLNWLRTVVKPLVDESCATLPEREHTGVGGSSMGGLFAIYAVLGGAASFGAAVVMSPALWYADGAVFRWLRRQPGPVGQIHLDVGLLEGEDTVFDARRMHDLLLDRGWTLGTSLHYDEDVEGDHDEASWARRLRERWARIVGMLSPPPGSARAAGPPR